VAGKEDDHWARIRLAQKRDGFFARDDRARTRDVDGSFELAPFSMDGISKGLVASLRVAVIRPLEVKVT
jgi:hypothetical protein